jgi:hypothetical protein
MSASFEEKSVWIQLLATASVLGAYFVAAGRMYSVGVRHLVPYAPLFAVAVVALVAVLVVGHVVVAIASRPEGRDERDRLIGWRAESRSGWILATGVILSIMGMIASYDDVVIAHLLLLSLLVSQVTAFVLQLVYYRRGL